MAGLLSCSLWWPVFTEWGDSVSQGLVLSIAQQGAWVTLLLVGPILGIGLAVGLLVSVLQAMTQINDQTLSFLPKLIVTVLALIFLGSWMLTTLLDYMKYLWTSLPGWV